MKAIEYVGKKFNRLTVISVKQGKKYAYPATGFCLCDCGNTCNIILYHLKQEHTKSCGCINKEHPQNLQHGLSKSKFYGVYKTMKTRTNNSNTPSYKNYGGRGIKCIWKNFIEFKHDMYESYLEHIKTHKESQTTLERIDNNQHYSKKNCRWATREEQSRNKRNNILFTINGETKCLRDWGKKLSISYTCLKHRIQRGWTLEETLGLTPRISRKPKNQRSNS